MSRRNLKQQDVVLVEMYFFKGTINNYDSYDNPSFSFEH